MLTKALSMGSVSVVVVVESLRIIITHHGGETNPFHLPSLISVAAALGASGCSGLVLPLNIKLVAGKLCLLVYCFPLRESSSQVDVLWEDHRNDACISTFGELGLNFLRSRCMH